MTRLPALLTVALLLLALPARADEGPPPDVHAGYAVGGILLGTAIGTGAVAVTQWAGLIGVQNDLYGTTHHRLEADGLIDDGNGWMLRGIVFTSIAGVSLVSSIITFATTSDRHDRWKQDQAAALLHRRSPRLLGLAAAPDPRGGLHAALELRW